MSKPAQFPFSALLRRDERIVTRFLVCCLHWFHNAWQIVVRARDLGGKLSSNTGTINLQVDRNKQSPKFDDVSNYQKTISETRQAGSEIMRVRVADADNVVRFCANVI